MSLITVQISPAYWKVSLNNPPLNMLNTAMNDALISLMDRLEKDEQVKVVVFDSAIPDYFMAHFDLLEAQPDPPRLAPSGLPVWVDLGLRLYAAPFLSIGLLRGRARGVGSEFLQMLDVRFASLEKAVLAQVEVGCGIFPGGGGAERLPRLVGRARALEIILGGEDFDAATAERYGWVNRALPDGELDAFVDRLARRVASFNRNAVVAAKQLINDRSPKPLDGSEQMDTQMRFFEIVGSPEAQARIGALLQAGLQQPGDLELHLGKLLGP